MDQNHSRRRNRFFPNLKSCQFALKPIQHTVAHICREVTRFLVLFFGSSLLQTAGRFPCFSHSHAVTILHSPHDATRFQQESSRKRPTVTRALPLRGSCFTIPLDFKSPALTECQSNGSYQSETDPTGWTRTKHFKTDIEATKDGPVVRVPGYVRSPL